MRVPLHLLCLAAIMFTATQAPPDRDAAWKEDLDVLAREFPAKQLDFAKLYPRFDTDLEAIRRDVPRMTDARVALALMRLIAGAHVAHTLVQTPRNGLFHRLPISVTWYADGLAVTAADEANRAALGLRVIRIGRLTPAELERAIEPYIAYELDGWLHLQSALSIPIYELLEAVGQTESDGRVKMTLARPDGTSLELLVTPGPWPRTITLVSAADALKIPLPLARRQPSAYYWFERLPDHRALYVQYNRCANDPAKPFATFAAEVFADADAHAHEIDRVIVDLRFNSGGNSTVIAPLIEGLRQRKALSGRGRLYALIGPGTFSSGLLAAMDFQRLQAVLIGEPSGERLNSYGEVRPLTLPRSGLVVQFSTKFFRLTKDDREELAPNVVVKVSLTDAVAGRDPVLDAALTHAR